MPEQQEQPSQISLESLRLKPGLPLEIILPDQNGDQHKAKLLAAVRRQIVMVALDNGSMGKEPPRFEFDDEIVIGGFTGQHDFAFSARITQVFQLPFPYVALTWPNVVTARLIRKAERQNASIPATMQLPDRALKHNVEIVNISTAGAMLHASAAPAKVDHLLILAFETRFDNETLKLSLHAIVRHTNETAPGIFQIGLQFREMGLHERLMLHYVVQSFAALNNPNIS